MGEIAGRYELQGPLGRGAGGAVFAAFDRLLDRRVAVKLFDLPLPDDTTNTEMLKRFRVEAKAAARLSHRNIVPIFDYGEDVQRAWIVMELVEGHSLKTLLDRGDRPPLAAALRTMAEVLSALETAHQAGVVHRDVKPANIMITRGGEAKLTDFGIARMEDSSLTLVGTVMGTPAYMAPEQFGGAVDQRADLWAAGAVLYELLTGQKAFPGEGFSTIMRRILTEEPAPPSARLRLPPGVDAMLDAILARALAKAAEDRYASAAEFAAALRRIELPAAATTPATPSAGPRVGPGPGPGARLGSPAAEAGRGRAVTGPPVALATARQRPPPPRRVILGATAGLLALVGAAYQFYPAAPAPAAAPSPMASPPESRAALAPAPAAPVPAAPALATPAPATAAAASVAPAAWLATTAGEEAPTRPAISPGGAQLAAAVAGTPPPAAQSAAPQPTQPAAPEALRPDYRLAAQQVLGLAACGLLFARAGEGDIDLWGVLRQTDSVRVQRTLEAARVPPEAGQRLTLFEADFCGVLRALQPAAAASTALPPVLLQNPNPLPAGQRLRFSVTMPAWGAYLHVFYLTADGKVGNLVQARSAPYPPHAVAVFGEAFWRAAAPFGTDLLIAVATERPLFEGQRRVVEGQQELAAALPGALQQVRKAAVAAMALTTRGP